MSPFGSSTTATFFPKDFMYTTEVFLSFPSTPTPTTTPLFA
jgi:hypothetical protein